MHITTTGSMMFEARADVSSWGRIVRKPQRVAKPTSSSELAAAFEGCPGGSLLPVGLRRSYGDSVLNSQGGLVDLTGLNRVLEFDPTTGVLRAEAGATLDQILRHVVPLGYFVPVTPGTRMVTLGGAIANDVHGKNHHCAGTFGRHVRRMGLRRSDGAGELTPDSGAMFAATIGGLGLTGIIEWAEIKLLPVASAELDCETIPFGSLVEFWQLAEESCANHEHTVAWIDCLAGGNAAGRGIFTRGNWASDGALSPHEAGRLAVPLEMPSGLLNRYTIGGFNQIYWRTKARSRGVRRQHYGPFFHPLDSIADWNLLYGRAGFWQYQCVVPPRSMRDAIAALLAEIRRGGQGSFLAVLKTCGPLPSPGMLSFPMEGATLALDFPNRGASTLELLARLDAIVAEAGGRLYAAKDGRVPEGMWRRGYPRLDEFAGHLDPRCSSDFWRRVAPAIPTVVKSVTAPAATR